MNRINNLGGIDNNLLNEKEKDHLEIFEQIIFKVPLDLFTTDRDKTHYQVGYELADSLKKCGWDKLIQQNKIMILSEVFKDLDKGVVWFYWSAINEKEFKEIAQPRQEEFGLR